MRPKMNAYDLRGKKERNRPCLKDIESKFNY